MKYKFHVYINVAKAGEAPNVVKALEYEENITPKPGDVIRKDRDDGPFVVMVFEIHAKPGTNEFIILGGHPF